MMEYDELILHVNQLYSKDGNGEKAVSSPFAPTLGIVVDTDDPLQMGRLRIFCPSLNDNPKKLHHLPWSVYMSPYGGSINNKGYTRGVDPANCTTSGSTQYGFWGIPEQGAHALVVCVDGDIRRRVFMGCVYDHQETHGVLTGRWDWGDGGIPNGPLSSTNSPMEPLATALKKAFQGDNKSREWRTRAADYQPAAVREDVGQTPNANKSTYLDQQYDKISEAEPDAWVKPILGAHGYDWSGYKSLGSFMASRAYGFSSPGQHRILLDDRAFNSRMDFRTATGHRIIMDDTNERMYFATSEGNAWIEMDKSGNIDIYTDRRFSVHSKKDINFTTDETFRVKAKKGIYMYSGDNNFQENLDEVPADGQIRIQAEDDIHVITKKNYRHLSFEDSLYEIGGKTCISVGESMFLQVEEEINILTNTGDINVTSSGNYNEMVKGNKNAFAEGTMTNASKGNAQMFTFDGKMDVGSQQAMTVKSMSSDVSMEAVGANSGKTGGVFMKSPESSHGVTSNGVTTSTNKSIRSKASENIEMNNAVPPTPDYPNPSSSIGPCDGGPTPPIPLTGLSGADLAAAAAYNAGFRGDSLATAVMIAGAESTWNPGAVGDQGLQSDKWGPSVGMWQGRTLNNPQNYTGVDRQRDINLIGGSSTTNIQNNANFAYALSNGGTNFRPWTTFTSGAYQNSQYSYESMRAVNAICNPGGGTGGDLVSSLGMDSEFFDGQDIPNIETFGAAFSDASAGNIASIVEQCLIQDIAALGNSFIMNGTSLNMQAIADIGLKGALSSTSVFAGLYTKINELAFAHDFSQFMQSVIFGALAVLGPEEAQLAAIPFIGQLAAGLSLIEGILGSDIGGLAGSLLGVQFLEDIGLEFLMGDICNYAVPHFDPIPEAIFFSGNFDISDITNIGMPGSSGTSGTLILD